jgi:hypothetical protein
MSNRRKRPDPPDIDAIAEEILAGMSLKERSLIAYMEERSLPYLQYAFDIYLTPELGDDPELGRAIMKRIWQRLQATHRIRLVGDKDPP